MTPIRQRSVYVRPDYGYERAPRQQEGLYLSWDTLLVTAIMGGASVALLALRAGWMVGE